LPFFVLAPWVAAQGRDPGDPAALEVVNEDSQ